MRLYAARGRRGAALRQYQHCVSVLQRELGVEPEAETKHLYQEILRQRPARVLPTEAGSSAEASSHGLRRLSPAEGSLIGRDAEMGSLRAALDADQRGFLTAIVGEAGIGKTRLIAELITDAERSGRRVLLGRAYESDQVLPFGPWVQALRAGRVTDDLAALAPAWRAELVRLIPELSAPPAPPSAVAADHLQLFESVAQAIGCLADRQPLLLVLEDFHWADEMSVRLLAFIARRLSTWPVLAAMTTREEDLHEAPMLRHALEDLEREGCLARMRLGPLSRLDTIRLIRVHARKGIEEAALARLGEQAWMASEGNPFVVVETVRAHAEGAAPEHGGGLELPERVRAIVRRRLERVSQRGQSLAAVAAVIGREFEFVLLQRAAGLGDDDAAAGVEELVRHRILHGIGDGFGFTHERIREVAYDALLLMRRRALHAAVGAALASLHAGQLEAIYDRLAHHFLHADDPAKAAEYLARFARKATRAYAHEEAVRSYREALRQLERLPVLEADARRLDIVPRLTRSLMFLGQFDEARDLLLAQRERLEQLGNPSLTGQYYLLLAHVYAFLGDRDRTGESARHALAAAERAGDEPTRGKAFYVLAMEGWWSGDPRQGIADGCRALALLDQTTELWWVGQAHFAIAANHVLTGDFEPAMAAATRALEIGDALGDSRVQTPAAWLMGTIHALRGDWDEGIVAGRRSLDCSPDPLNRADALGWFGLTYLEKGDVPEAIRLLEQSVEHWSEFRARPAQGGFRILLGYAYLMRGDTSRALKLADEGLALARETRYRLAVGWGERLLALIAQRRGDRPEARARLEQALGTFTAISARFEAARTRLLLAELWADLGEGAAATSLLTEARQTFVTLGIQKYARRAEALAQALDVHRSDTAMTEDRLPRWA
jgi:tetratricopeptide (TPR) repeat protein